jgi:hypothetical protein
MNAMQPMSLVLDRLHVRQRLLIALVVWPSLALSQESLGLLPFGECRTGYWSSNRNLDDAQNLSSSTCLLNWKLQPAKNIRFAANTRLSQEVSSAGSGFRGRLREAYVQADFGDVSLKLGRQIVVWGRSDRISPTDVMSSRDYTARVPDDDEQRNGNDLATARWQMTSDITATIHVGLFESHRFPVGLLPTNLISIAAPKRPEYALKIDRVGEGVDFSLSYFDGFNKTARYDFIPTGQSGDFQSQHERMQMVGIDFATSKGRWTVRGEAAAFWMTAICKQCQADNFPRRQIQSAVLGLDRDIFDTANINFQFFILKRNDYQSPESLLGAQRLIANSLDRLNGEFGAIERGLTLRLSERFFNDYLKIEASGVFDLNNASRLLRARLSYAVNDQVKLHAGVDNFQGKNQSTFGSKQKNNAAFVEFAWVF